MSIKKSVGLVILVEMPNRGLVAILQRRGPYNFEEGETESWSGGCQVTTHGTLEEKEAFKTALFREAAEELGEDAMRLIYKHSDDLVEAFHLNVEDKEVITYAVKMDFAFIKEIRLGPSTGGLELVSRNEVSDIAEDLRLFSRDDGVQDNATIAMFPDEKAAVLKAFELFSH